MVEASSRAPPRAPPAATTARPLSLQQTPMACLVRPQLVLMARLASSNAAPPTLLVRASAAVDSNAPAEGAAAASEGEGAKLECGKRIMLLPITRLPLLWPCVCSQ